MFILSHILPTFYREREGKGITYILVDILTNFHGGGGGWAGVCDKFSWERGGVQHCQVSEMYVSPPPEIVKVSRMALSVRVPVIFTLFCF